MRVVYGICRNCDAMVVPPTTYEARADGAAQLHARVTGHSVLMLDDCDPDEPLYVVAGEPGLFGVGEVLA